MRNKLLEFVRCPNCKASDFEVKIKEKNDKEIRTGAIICRECNKYFSIKKGISNFLFQPSPESKKEIEGSIVRALRDYTKMPEIYNDLWLLNLPFCTGKEHQYADRYGRDIFLIFNDIIEKFDLRNKSICDLGVGNAWSTRFFAKKEKSCYCIALDISSIKYRGLESGDLYMNADGTYFERILAEMEKTPFQDNCFDIVSCFGSIHHCSELDTTFREIGRILKPGGMACIIDSTSGLKSDKSFALDSREGGMNEHCYTIFKYIKSAKRAGFKVDIQFPKSTELRYFNFYFPFKRAILKFFLYPFHILRGFGMVMIAKKL